MKRSIALFVWSMFLVAGGTVYADEILIRDEHTSEKMIRSDGTGKDGQGISPTEIESRPALPDEYQGSAAGGMSGTDPDTKGEKAESPEKDRSMPGYGYDWGGTEKRWDPLAY